SLNRFPQGRRRLLKGDVVMRSLSMRDDCVRAGRNLLPVRVVSDDDLCLRVAHAVGDGLATEGREQRYMNCSEPPDSESGDNQLDGLWKERRHLVARLHAQLRQENTKRC